MKFKIIIDASAQKDLRDILNYIADTLLEPEIARRIYFSIRSQIMSLDEFPMRHPVIKEEPYATLGIRRIPVENYTTFYFVNTDKYEVHILRILYNRREWQNLL